LSGTLHLGQVLQDYRIEEVLGEGSFGTVYRASHTFLTIKNSSGPNTPVMYAIKELTQTKTSSVESFVREAEILIAMSNTDGSNIVRIIHLLRDQGTYFLIMEFVKGQTLAKVAATQLLEEHLIAIAIEICQGLQLMHGNKPQIIHRDIKPENINVEFVGNDIQVKILDLGSAAILDGQQKKSVVGSPRFASPIQLYGEEANPFMDQYSLGATLYYLMTDCTAAEEHRLLPFPFEYWENMSEQQKVLSRYRAQLLQDMALTPGSLPAHWDAHTQARKILAATGYSQGLQKLVLKMLAYDDKDKYPSIAKVQSELEQLNKPIKRKPLSTILLILIVIIFLVIVASLLSVVNNNKFIASVASIRPQKTQSPLTADGVPVTTTIPPSTEFPTLSPMVPTSTPSHIPPPTNTPRPSNTSTPQPTETRLPTFTNTYEPSLTNTFVSTPTPLLPTSALSHIPPPTNTPRPSNTSTPQPTETPMLPTQLPSSPTLTPSPISGNKIAFVIGIGAARQVYTMNLDGSGKTQLTTNGINWYPSWSPDGRTILFNCDIGAITPDKIEVCSMSSNGANQHQITNQHLYEDSAVWSPNGQHIAFVSRGTNLADGEIYIMDADGSNWQQLTSMPQSLEPSWSPDSQHIAFTLVQNGANDIYVTDVTASAPIRITNNGRKNHSPVWSPDGQHIAFASKSGNKNDIFVMEINGTNSAQLTTRGNNFAPTWSPDSQHIAFVSDQGQGWQIYVMDVNGSNLKQLTRACYALWISWFRTAHDGLILAKHSALKAIPLAIFINIHSVKRYFDLS